jgi:hypothetical protein
LVNCLVNSSIMKSWAIFYFEASVDLQRTILNKQLSVTDRCTSSE